MSRTDDWADGWNEGREQAIRDCIAVVEQTFSKRGVDSGAVLDECTAALRALLEGEKS